MLRIVVLLALLTSAAHAEDTIDAEKWLRARGFTGELDPVRHPENCSEINVGKAHETALQCTEIEETSAGGEDIPVGRVITHDTINVMRAGKLVVVLDASVRYEPFDGLPGFKALMSSKLRVAKDGMSATIGPGNEDDLFGCTHPHTCGRKEWEKLDDKIANAMCAARGTYVWTRSGRFERRAKSPAR